MKDAFSKDTFVKTPFLLFCFHYLSTIQSSAAYKTKSLLFAKWFNIDTIIIMKIEVFTILTMGLNDNGIVNGEDDDQDIQ